MQKSENTAKCASTTQCRALLWWRTHCLHLCRCILAPCISLSSRVAVIHANHCGLQCSAWPSAKWSCKSTMSSNSRDGMTTSDSRFVTSIKSFFVHCQNLQHQRNNRSQLQQTWPHRKFFIPTKGTYCIFTTWNGYEYIFLLQYSVPSLVCYSKLFSPSLWLLYYICIGRDWFYFMWQPKAGLAYSVCYT